jgi:hypothetical protein
MAWSTPLTAVANAALTAAQWNASVRDNFLETAPAKATAAGQYFVSTAANALAARTPGAATVSGSETTTNTTYADLTTSGPNITVTTGTQALVFISSRIGNSTATATSYASWQCTGATTVAVDDRFAVEFQPEGASRNMRATAALLVTGMTPGSTTFGMRYRVTAGTGTYGYRQISVLPF